MNEGAFPDKGKSATVLPLDKGKPNKNYILNCKLVSILITYSKIFQNLIKEQLVYTEYRESTERERESKRVPEIILKYNYRFIKKQLKFIFDNKD